MPSLRDLHSLEKQLFPGTVLIATSCQALTKKLADSKSQWMQLLCFLMLLIFLPALDYRCKHEIEAFGVTKRTPWPRTEIQGIRFIVEVKVGFRSRRCTG